MKAGAFVKQQNEGFLLKRFNRKRWNLNAVYRNNHVRNLREKEPCVLHAQIYYRSTLHSSLSTPFQKIISDAARHYLLTADSVLITACPRIFFFFFFPSSYQSNLTMITIFLKIIMDTLYLLSFLFHHLQSFHQPLSCFCPPLFLDVTEKQRNVLANCNNYKMIMFMIILLTAFRNSPFKQVGAFKYQGSSLSDQHNKQAKLGF